MEPTGQPTSSQTSKEPTEQLTPSPTTKEPTQQPTPSPTTKQPTPAPTDMRDIAISMLPPYIPNVPNGLIQQEALDWLAENDDEEEFDIRTKC